jgi:hypothetical protein
MPMEVIMKNDNKSANNQCNVKESKKEEGKE